ncbi:MAG: hypothetical protein NXI23_01905 [Bacteroidetes bacterium]|jgi:SOS-response transcriptional repressor LexA|nr:hypothetical protein [Bacteroidota bacterium]MDF1864207.1 S24 family peptidase [Saprospiraceae bacterium]
MKPKTNKLLILQPYFNSNIRIPFFKYVNAGLSSNSKTNLDCFVDLNQLLTSSSDNLIIAVQNHLFLNLGINKGDVIIIERNEEPKCNDLVLVETKHHFKIKLFPSLKPKNKVIGTVTFIINFKVPREKNRCYGSEYPKIDLNELLITNTNSIIILVKGNSMRDADIHENDLVILDKSIELREEDLVVAKLNNRLVIKRLSKIKKNALSLRVANSNHENFEDLSTEDVKVSHFFPLLYSTFPHHTTLTN